MSDKAAGRVHRRMENDISHNSLKLETRIYYLAGMVCAGSAVVHMAEGQRTSSSTRPSVLCLFLLALNQGRGLPAACLPLF